MTIFGQTRAIQDLESGHPKLRLDEYDYDDWTWEAPFLGEGSEIEEIGEAPEGTVKKKQKRVIKREVDALVASLQQTTPVIPPEYPKKAGKPPVVMEMWTWKQEVLRQAVKEGWAAGPAVSIETGFDLRSADGQKRAKEEVIKHKPDLLVMAFPCSPWSMLQNLAKDSKTVEEKRKADEPFLRLAKKLADEQEEKGKKFVIETLPLQELGTTQSCATGRISTSM